ncbi:MAG: hypothetical protein HY016_01895 [Nitrosomonadales bacterium]|nr:hypothetical protein [Nitrosomonadales bacterium]
MTDNKLRAGFSPTTTITISAIVAVGLALLSVMLAMSGPWLGMVFDRSYDGAGIRVAQVIDNSPSAGKIKAGDIIVALEVPTQQRVEVSSLVTQEDPDYAASYAEFNAFMELQQRVWQAISAPSFAVVLEDGRQVVLAPAAAPGLAVLPVAFWWLLLFGGASFFLGISAWSLRRGEPVTRALAVSGMGFMVSAYTCGIYIARELALPSERFFALVAISHLGLVVFAYAAILTFWYYPRRLGNGPAAWLFALWGAAIWLNETLQWWNTPPHPYYAHLVVAFFMLVLLTSLQWRQFRGVPLERAMLKWMLSTMVITLGFNVLLFCVPIIWAGLPVTSTALTFGSVFVFFLGLTIGNIRYHQFDLEHWWFKAWQWLIFILITLVADAIFVYFMHITDVVSVGLAIAMGCIYLLLRQWFWGRYAGKNSRTLERALPHLIDALMLQQQKITPDQQWRQLIAQIFNPLSMKALSDERETIAIERGGLALKLPSLDGAVTIEAFCCDQGKRLFTAADVNLANRLLELMRHSRDILSAREQGAQEERHRIQRDLHDDVAARLLSLLHQTREPMVSKVARNALRGLRDVIHLLGDEEAPLESVMTDIEAGAREQLAGLGIHFEWRSPDNWPAVTLRSQQHINLRRIAREAIANALKHANPENIVIEVDLGQKLCLRICNDGAAAEPSGWIPGRGLNNIKSRVAEMDGSHKWVIEREGTNKQYCCLAVCIPLSPSK